LGAVALETDTAAHTLKTNYARDDSGFRCGEAVEPRQTSRLVDELEAAVGQCHRVRTTNFTASNALQVRSVCA
jgi:hypothetical protein